VQHIPHSSSNITNLTTRRIPTRQLSIIYKELFLNYLCGTVRGWSSMPVPARTVFLLAL
jgi:hypothetical protein